MSDAGFAGGKSFGRPAKAIVGALDPEIFARGREGRFSYHLPLTSGIYEIHLFFAETAFPGEELRTMRIAINGKTVEPKLDVVADAGGANIATEKIYTGIQPAPDGQLHLSFTGTTNVPAFVNAIEIMGGDNNGVMRPVRQTALSNFYLDGKGQLWSADQWFNGGRIGNPSEMFPGPAQQGMFQNERFGNFNYSIPVVPQRRYSLTLYFQDAWFARKHPVGQTSGMRIFDISCNGKPLLPQFDILKEAEPGSARVVRKFPAIEPTAQGKIVLAFHPSLNYALVNAIEIEDETSLN